MGNLEAELASRPSHKTVTTLRHRVTSLEAELADERRARREPLMPFHHVGGKRLSPTRAAIARDKAIAKAFHEPSMSLP